MGNEISNQIFFDNVRVPGGCLLGELNKGFYQAMAVLEFERANTGWVAECHRQLEEFVQVCKETRRNGKTLLEDPGIREALARIAVELEVWRLAAWRASWWFSQREKLGPMSYDLSGFYWKQFAPRHAETMMDILGPYGQLRTGSKRSVMKGAVDRMWQYRRSLHGGGTIEIYKVILAERGLGLPRRR